MSTVKCLIVVAVKRQWPLFQLDINNAFLHGDLYMKLPSGLSLSAASSSTSAPLGYSHSFTDYSLFVKGSPGSFTALVVYVDDIILTGDNATEISALKQFLHTQFKIKDLGQLYYFWGIEISYFPSGLLLNQKKFVSDLLSEYKCEDVSPVACPLELHEKLSADSGEVLDKPEFFRSLVGKLLFLTHTRPDICFDVQHLSQFLKCPRVPHMFVALHILRYLKYTLDIGLFYSNDSDLTVSAYGESLIGWKSKKQPVVSLSSTEAEYRAISKVIGELTWMVRLLSDLHVPVSLPISVFFFIIKLLYILLRIRSSMNVQNILKWIVTLFAPSWVKA
uniref:Uncharacterized mitochondrial protein AtMg00810-like n=1 Tax=Nicotiana tabacum TaxID=4097 RepID=A0A1S4BU89_TOBAC|nr:PREDICTED: uncharacterized mitochondrial protein AtMg00810-like [Nicotiana tabacum]